jgi:hypothetical protein
VDDVDLATIRMHTRCCVVRRWWRAGQAPVLLTQLLAEVTPLLQLQQQHPHADAAVAINGCLAVSSLLESTLAGERGCT